MKIVVFGATGGTGRQVVGQAVTAGHAVRALVRSAAGAALPAAVSLVEGSALHAKAVSEAVAGTDVVFSCLGSRPIETLKRHGRIVAPAMGRIVETMRSHHVRRLVAISTYGAGDSRQRLRLSARWVMTGLLWGELADKNAMETVIRSSDLDWTIIRPVNLKNGPPTGCWQIDPARPVGLTDWIARGDVAAVMLASLADPGSIGRALLVTGA